MTDYMISYFVSFFQNPSTWGIWGIGLAIAIAFGAVWLAGYRPPLFKKPWLWAVLAGSAFLTLVAISFIQIPLQVWAEQALNHFWSREVLTRWILLAGIPLVLLTGLVQEGAKLVPVVAYWKRSGKNIDPKLGLAIGAVAGAGFGIFEAFWAYNVILTRWPEEALPIGGYVVLASFLERFFAVAAHIAFSALAGYGLAKGRGWQFYLIASFLHGLLNYGVILLNYGRVFWPISLYYASRSYEIYAAVLAVLVTAWALWLRWRKRAATADPAISSP